MSIQKYPIGHQDFEHIITQDFVYVDKTSYVFELANRGGYYFLSRPRRFGKSLLISTFDYLFRGNKELFAGLYIYDKWDFDEFPVIRLSFNTLAYENNNLNKTLLDSLDKIAILYNVALTEISLKERFQELIYLLYASYNQKVVILIDEYDKPLIDYLEKENIAQAIQNRAILKTFYSVLKDADPYLKMVFITGISKFSQVSIFSDLNNLYDLTLRKDYNEICGISQIELEQNFKEELKIYDPEEIKQWYNGYKWDIDSQTVYNPFSLLNFFSDGKFSNYWYTTGTPTFLMKKSRSEHFYEFEETTCSEIKLQSFDIEDIDLIPVLFQTGYLTLIGKEPILDDYILSFPNREVKQAYLEKLADTYIDSQKNPSKVILGNLLKAFRSKNKENFEQSINQAFAQIPYDLWQKENEQFYHAIVHLLFSLLGVYIHSEVHTKDGRADALIIFEDNVYCLEFKLDKSSQEAVQQIKERGYVNQYIGGNKPIHLIGINFSSEKKKVESLIWETL
jgi:hypothetical protein